MMHSTCFNSNVAVRCNGSFSLSYRDSSNFLLDDRFDRNPIQSCCCYCCCSCCCSANSICGFPTNPNNLLYGLRQSALIQWTPSRRVVLHGARQSCFAPRFSGRSEVGRRGYYYEKLYSLKERSLNGMMGKWGSGGFECRGLSERRSRYPFGSFEDTVDVMLSILTEDVVEEPLGGRERNARLSRRLQVEKREKVTTDDSSDKITKKKKKTGTGGLQGHLKCDYEFSGTHSREEDKRLRNDERRKDESEIVVRGENSRARKEQKGSSYRDEIDRARKEQKESSYKDEIDRARKEEKGSFSKSENHRARKEEKGSFSRSENHRARKEVKESFSRTENHDARKDENESFSRNENHKLRKEGSSCSSYYSLSSTGDIESDDELEVKQGKYVGESSSVYERDGKRYYDEDVSERFDRHQDFVVDQQIVSEKKYSADELYEDSKRVNYDWRKETEKKLSETPTKQMESRKELAEEKLRLSAFKRKSNVKSSDLSQKYDDREKSTLSININEERGHQNVQRTEMITGQFESRTKYKQFAELSSEISGSNIETTSSSQKQYIGTEENFTQTVGSVQETTGKQVAGRVIRVDSRKQIPERVNDVSALQEIDIRGTSSSLPETTLRTLEGNSAMVVGLLDHTKEEEQRTSQLVTKQAGSILNSQQFTGISETVNINNQITLVSCSNSDVRTNMQEQRSDTSFPQAKVTDTQKVPQKRLSIEESSSTSVINSFGESKERLDLIGVGVSQTESAKDTRTRRTTKASSFHVGMPKEAAIPYKPLKLNPESSEKPIRAYVGVTDSSHPSIVTATKPEPVSSRPLNVEPVHELSSEWSDFGTSELRIQAEKNSELLGTDKRGDLHEESVDFISHDDALHSAARQQNSSTHIVGEFVEMVRHGISTSQIQEDTKIHEMDLIHGDGQHKQKSSSKDGSTRSHRKDDGSGRLSRGSGREGPSDEMWHVNDQSSQGPPETDAVENTSTTENGSVKRSGRSLWNVIGDIVRMRWGSRSETLTSKSGGKNSPNQSTSSEAWFSGHEQDENNDENAKVERPVTPQESSSGEKQQSEEIPSPSRGDVLSPIHSKNEIAEAGLDMQLSSNTNIGSTSVGASSSLAEESYVIEGTSSGTAIVKASLPLPAIRLGRSPAVKDISEAGQANAYGQGTMVEMEQQVPTRVTEITTTNGSGSGIMVEIEQQVPSNVAEVLATTGKNGELKRRKLQRKDQVLKDRFDEWEEAHIRETEQRKIDETFMREALSEARKAADVWEVPVGAVLVQDGKIIARGYNLVEELRDSTAHAEMICIREASKVLRTWRLSETTLYVTLEPCPMCAGAIFQARVDTVVWGAPNKLLGADGSWIRLFPDGAGSSESELTDKPPAPVHPFHPNVTIRRGVLSSECADVMQQFFQLRRKKKEKREPPTPPSCLPISHHHSKFFTKMHDAFNIMFCL